MRIFERSLGLVSLHAAIPSKLAWSICLVRAKTCGHDMRGVVGVFRFRVGSCSSQEEGLTPDNVGRPIISFHNHSLATSQISGLSNLDRRWEHNKSLCAQESSDDEDDNALMVEAAKSTLELELVATAPA
eukprot:5824112-Amphidinium_carterae.1